MSVTKPVVLDIDEMMGRRGSAERHAAADDARLRALFDAYQLPVLGYCMRRAPTTAAHDATAEVFAVAWRRIDDVPVDNLALPWLYGVARRVLANDRRGRDRTRRLQQRLEHVGSMDSPSPETVLVRRAAHQAVIDAARQLNSTDREVLYLTAWEGLSHAETAAALGISHTAVRKRLQRARARLGRRLGRDHPDRLLSNEETS